MPEQVSQNSILLSLEDNQQLHKLLGNRCQSLSTAVVQLYSTAPPHHNYYIKQACGVLCFVKDNIRKNYFFRLYCLQKNTQIWEHEMYENFIYTDATSFLHVFEGEEGIIAFNFASTEEATLFKNQVNKKIEMKRKKAELKAQNSHRQPYNNISNNHYNDYRNDLSSKRSGRKGKITKADIGNPTDFKHISHVGWSQNYGFDIDTEDEQLKTLFDKAGVSEKHLRDKDTREFIYDFIAKHGGRDAVAETNRNSHKPPPTPNSAPVPPVPPRGAPKPHVRAAPPPPPNRTPPVKTEKVPPPPPMDIPQVAAPPPPPPPPVFENNVNANSNDIPPAPPAINDNSALMMSIRNGTNLKPVEDRQLPPVDNARGDLLSEIRKGFNLKPVSERENKPAPPRKENEDTSCDLAAALKKALAGRKDALLNSEDDDDDDDLNDDEWDD